MVLGMSDMAVMAHFTPELLGGRRNLWAGTRMRVLDLNLPRAVVAALMADSRQRGATLVAVGSDLGVFRSATQALKDRYTA